MSVQNYYNVQTINMGAGLSDYLETVKYDHIITQGKTIEDLPRESEENGTDALTKLESVVAKVILKEPTDVYLLQEVGNADRHLISELIEKGFSIHHFVHPKSKPWYNQAIVLDKKRFKNITNLSTNLQLKNSKEEVAFVKATDSTTLLRIGFVSLRIPGFNLSAPENNDLEDMQSYCSQVSNLISTEMDDCDGIIMGGDFNVYPEYPEARNLYPTPQNRDAITTTIEEDKDRETFVQFRLFKEMGFNLHRSHNFTNVNMIRKEEHQREFDYFMSRSFKVNEIKTLLNFTPKENFSDHRPVHGRFTYESKEKCSIQ